MVLIPKPSYLLKPFWVKALRPSPALSVAEIEAVMAHYNLGAWQISRNLAGGNSGNVLLQTGQGQKVLKRYRWTLASTQHEHSILCHLAGADFPSPGLEVNQAGLTYTELGDKHYAIYGYIPGYCYTNYLLRPKTRRRLISQAGETLACFHQLVTGFIPAGKRLNGFKPESDVLWRDVAWHLEVLEQYLERAASKQSPDTLGTFLLKIAPELKHDLIDLGRYYEQPNPQLPKVVNHGDYSPKNILFQGQTITAVLDFGDACINLRALDVARGVTSFARAGRFGVDGSLAQTFLQAYQARQPLSPQEVEAIPDLIRWRYLQNIVWSLQGVRPEDNLLAGAQEKWASAQWIKTHADTLRASLLSAFEDK